MHSRKLLVILLAVVFIIGAVGSAGAVSSYLSSFSSTYPSSATASFGCQICHVPAGPPSRNPYGTAYRNAGHNFTTIEPQDSDGDGATNIAEINAGTNPGDAGSKPAPAACTEYTYSEWSACDANGQQTRTVTGYTPPGCGGTPSTPAVLTQACTPPPVACTGYTYSAWSACGANGQQTRTVTANTPAGCTGTPPTAAILNQACTPLVDGLWVTIMPDQSINSYTMLRENSGILLMTDLDLTMEDWQAFYGLFDGTTSQLTTLLSRGEQLSLTCTFLTPDSASCTITSCTSTASANCKDGTVGFTYTMQKLF
ncbi:MAG: thrombospondin type 3 repeat-containing protein [Thermodesulfovibrionales bacterium]